MPAQFNHRDGVPGGTNFVYLTPDQEQLMRYLQRRMAKDPRSVACYILNHTTLDEQKDALAVYRWAQP